MSYITLKKSDLPSYLKTSKFYLSLNDSDNESFTIESTKYKHNEIINNIEDFENMFEIINFFDAEYPTTYINYYTNNSKEVLNFYYDLFDEYRVKDMFLKFIDISIEIEDFDHFILIFTLFYIVNINPINIPDYFIEYGLDNKRKFLKKYSFNNEKNIYEVPIKGYNTLSYDKKREFFIKKLIDELSDTQEIDINSNFTYLEVNGSNIVNEFTENICINLCIYGSSDNYVIEPLYEDNSIFKQEYLELYEGLYKFRMEFLEKIIDFNEKNDETKIYKYKNEKVEDCISFSYYKRKKISMSTMYNDHDEYGELGTRFNISITYFNNKHLYKCFKNIYEVFMINLNYD